MKVMKSMKSMKSMKVMKHDKSKKRPMKVLVVAKRKYTQANQSNIQPTQLVARNTPLYCCGREDIRNCHCSNAGRALVIHSSFLPQKLAIVKKAWRTILPSLLLQNTSGEPIPFETDHYYVEALGVHM